MTDPDGVALAYPPRVPDPAAPYDVSVTSPSACETNRDGRITEPQRRFFRSWASQRLRTAHVATAGGMALLAAGGLASVHQADYVRGAVLIAVIMLGFFARARSRWTTVLADLTDGSVRSATTRLAPFGPGLLRAANIHVGAGADRIWIAGIAPSDREIFGRGGTFQLHYLPRSRMLLSIEPSA